MSIRLRLTMLYTAILALMLAGFGLAVYATLERSTLNTLEDALREQARVTRGLRELNPEPGQFGVGSGADPGVPGTPDFGPGSRIPRPQLQTGPAPVGQAQSGSAQPGQFQPGQIPPGLGPPPPFGAPETYLQVRDTDGNVVARSDTLVAADITLPLDRQALARVQTGLPVSQVVSVGSGRFLVYDELVRSRPPAGQPVGIVQVARSLAELDASLATLRTLLIGGAALATVVACGAGWLLAGYSLRPIERITRTAAAIGRERDFTRRVSYDGPEDEVGRLARTFNTMLGELHESHEGATHALEAQRRFVADASHELRTPLTTIRGNLRLLGLEPPISPEDRSAVLGDLTEETERLSRLVNDLLTLARADAGRPLHHDVIAVAPVIEDICRQAGLLAPGREVRCETGPADAVTVGDRDALKQVLLILVDNAVKFTPAGGIVTLSAETDPGAVLIRVADTGVGIAEAELPRIFERFFRGDPARSRGGAGLGLPIARALVEAQGGGLSVRSRIGTGTVFTLRLPRARADAPAQPVDAARAARTPVTPAAGG